MARPSFFFFLHCGERITHCGGVELPQTVVRDAISRALAEDIGPGDVTTLATVPPRAVARAAMVARQELVVAGLQLAEEAFGRLSRKVVLKRAIQDGQTAKKGQKLLEVHGPARAMLTAERVALNYLQRLSGIASLTRQFVTAVAGTRTVILDTRKTTPGLRVWEKYAVRCGGGQNHRHGLFDMVLIKDNHLAVLRQHDADPVRTALRLARQRYPNLMIEIEVESVAEAEEAIRAGADRILLDNMRVAEVKLAVKAIAGRAEIEASGGVTLSTVRDLARTGVDFISVGALTHSAPAVDIGLDFLNDYV